HNMHAAGEQLVRLFNRAGLAGSPSSMNLDRIQAGRSDPAYMLPATDSFAEARIEFRKACNAMGWRQDMPYFGAARVTVALLCEEQRLDDVAMRLIASGQLVARRRAAKAKLNEGLSALVSLWRIARRS